MDEKTFYGTLSLFIYVTHPQKIDEDRPARRSRRTIYKAWGITKEEAQEQTLGFINRNPALSVNHIWATWQPEPIELETSI
jgi:hypothetical protein